MLSHIQIEDIIRGALREDIGTGEDVTSALTIPAGAMVTAELNARGQGILAGLIPALTAFSLIDDTLDITVHARDGDIISPNQTIAVISGSARSILTAERTALNLLTHLCGIASITAVFVNEVRDTKAKIYDTRKTLPGLRALQKYAVTCGGGVNHRFGLNDMILIKDNHIAIAGGIHAALDAVSCKSDTMKIEIEVDTLEQLEDVLGHGGADIVMLDNFDIDNLKRGTEMVNGRMIVEASGGVNLQSVKAIAQTGVDYISVGSITNNANALDIGLDINE